MDMITTYYAQQGWQVPWDRVRLVPGGWALRAGSLLCRDTNCTTIALPGRYEIHYREPLDEAVLCHELRHCLDMEREGLLRYVLSYAAEYVRYGYRRCRYEVAARDEAKRYVEWRQS